MYKFNDTVLVVDHIFYGWLVWKLKKITTEISSYSGISQYCDILIDSWEMIGVDIDNITIF